MGKCISLGKAQQLLHFPHGSSLSAIPFLPFSHQPGSKYSSQDPIPEFIVSLPECPQLWHGNIPLKAPVHDGLNFSGVLGNAQLRDAGFQITIIIIFITPDPVHCTFPGWKTQLWAEIPHIRNSCPKTEHHQDCSSLVLTNFLLHERRVIKNRDSVSWNCL